jgi:hypothetical protein
MFHETAQGRGQIVIYDFNPYNIRKMKANHSGELDQSHEREWTDDEDDVSSVDDLGVFDETVGGKLPFVACVSEEEYEYHGVMLDEERVIGLKVCYPTLRTS